MDELKKTKKLKRESTAMDKTEDEYTADDFEEDDANNLEEIDNLENTQVSLGNPFKNQKNFFK